MTILATMFQAYMTVCMVDGYGNLHSCKTFTPKEGAQKYKREKQIKDFQTLNLCTDATRISRLL